MPPSSKNAIAPPPLFLGLELATDQLRATIVDENLELVGVESIDFDVELPEFQTQGGIFTTPGDAYTTPITMWIQAFDFLLEKIATNQDIKRIRAIGGCAQHALVWWARPMPALASEHQLQLQLSAAHFTIPHTPTALDASAHTHALALEAALGGPDRMAARVGTCAHPALAAGQLLRTREQRPDAWEGTRRIQPASAFLASLICGAYVPMSESEACATGMWVHEGAAGPGRWDETVLDIVGGSREQGEQLRKWLGPVETSGSKRIGVVSRYMVERFGFDPETIVAPFTSDHLANYVSLAPSSSDAVLAFGPIDVMSTPAQHYIPTRLYNLYPHPAQDPSEKRRYIATLSSRNADVPRALVRDMYTKSWSAFDRLVAIVPPGGSIGLDDKLFSFWLLQGDAFPFAHVKGIYRFETGIKVNEFRDLRANPRCLVESQLLSFRVRWSRMLATGVLGPGAVRSSPAVSPTVARAQHPHASGILSSLGLSFDAYDAEALPARVLATGAAANFPAVANVAGDVFAAPVFLPASQIDSAQVSAHRNAPPPGFPARAALGGAYLARWAWARERPGGKDKGLGGAPAAPSAGAAAVGTRGVPFEEDVRRVLAKRWAATGGAPAKTNVTGVPQQPIALAPPGAGASQPGSGASTPYGRRGAGLGADVLVEEDEEEDEAPPHAFGLGFAEADMGLGGTARVRTATSSTVATSSSAASALSSLGAPSTAYTTPDVNGLGQSAPSPGLPPTPGAGTLVPVAALPTGEAEAQLGLAKVADADLDAFMAYGALVPEFCRLEGMLVKGLV